MMIQRIGYDPRTWIDRIYKVGPDGKPIIKKDSNGNPVINPYTLYPEYETIEEGTRFYANHMNHIEQGIAAAHIFLSDMDRAIKRLQAQQEIDGRVPGNGGTFVDAFDGQSTRLTKLTAHTDVTASTTDNKITVADTQGFAAMTYVTVYDGEHYEQVQITAIEGKVLSVKALQHSYQKGAKVARSTTSVDAEKQIMRYGNHTILQITEVEVG